MNVNFSPGLSFNGRIDCKGSMIAMKKNFSNKTKQITSAESKKLIGTSDLSGEYINEKTMRRNFTIDTDKITRIDKNTIQFVSDDNNMYAELSYQPKNATEIEKKLNYMLALNAYNTAHQNDIDTEIIC